VKNIEAAKGELDQTFTNKFVKAASAKTN
jgi:NitT/TauT family transport system substrate-binding protein